MDGLGTLKATIVVVAERVCNICGESKPETAFYEFLRGTNWRSLTCRRCCGLKE